MHRVLVWDIQHKERNSPSLMCPVVGENWMKPESDSPWLVCDICFCDRKGIQPIKHAPVIS